MPSVDDAIIRDMLEASTAAPTSPYAAALSYVEQHLVGLSQPQAQALAYLEVVGGKRYKTLIEAVLRYRALTGDVEPILRAIEAIALYSKFTGLSATVSRQKTV